jgi:hypothetical protein
VLAFLIAIDPWLTAFSRLADGSILGIGLGLLALTALARLVLTSAPDASTGGDDETHAGQSPETSSAQKSASHAVAQDKDFYESAGWRWVAAISAGVLLVSGVMAWGWLLSLLGFGWLYRVELNRSGLFRSRYAWWAGLAALVAGTFGLVRFDALPLTGASLGLWLGQITGNGGILGSAAGIGDYGPAWPWVRLVIDEPFIALFGSAGLVLSSLRAGPWPPIAGRRWQLFLCLWVAVGIAFWLLPGRSPFALSGVVVPLMIFAAWLVDYVVRAAPTDLVWREVGAVGATLTVLLISGVFWAAAMVSSRAFDPVMAQATGVLFALAGGIVVAYAAWSSRRHAIWTAVVFVMIVLAPVSIRSGWQLNQPAGPAHLAGFFSRFTHPEVRLLVEDIEILSAHRAGSPHELPIQLQVASQVSADGAIIPARPDPALGWYLRRMRDLSWVPAPDWGPDAGEDVADAGTLAPLAVTLVDAGSVLSEQGEAGNGDRAQAARLNLPEGYAGSVYHVEAEWLPGALLANQEQIWPWRLPGGLADAWSAWIQPVWRWVVYRNTSELPATRDVVLWAPVYES